MKIKKGDKIIVVSGKDKGKTGTVVKSYPADSKVLIEGINVSKRHSRPSAKNRKGQIVEKSMPIHASNVMIVDSKSGKPTRVGFKRDANGRTRYAKKSGNTI